MKVTKQHYNSIGPTSGMCWVAEPSSQRLNMHDMHFFMYYHRLLYIIPLLFTWSCLTRLSQVIQRGGRGASVERVTVKPVMPV